MNFTSFPALAKGLCLPLRNNLQHFLTSQQPSSRCICVFVLLHKEWLVVQVEAFLADYALAQGTADCSVTFICSLHCHATLIAFLGGTLRLLMTLIGFNFRNDALNFCSDAWVLVRKVTCLHCRSRVFWPAPGILGRWQSSSTDFHLDQMGLAFVVNLARSP
jgi:hypothetical protein